MKVIGFTLAAAICLSTFQQSAPAQNAPAAPKKRPKIHALLVAVNGYQRTNPRTDAAAEKEWWALNTTNDVEQLEKALVARFGKDNIEIHKLTTKEQTTHQAIKDAFQKYLIEATKERPGDSAYFHYSGHGAQALDQNGDESSDGLDETLVPSDYVSLDDHSNDILDDELGQWLDKLRANKPANVTVTMDSCFSGTATRGGTMIIRGRQHPGRGKTGARGAASNVDKQAAPFVDGASGESNLVFLSAAQSNQTAKETIDEKGKGIGLFSFALVRALGTASDAKTTYRDLYNQINGLMLNQVRDQTPQLEGQKDVTLLGAEIVPPQPFLGVSWDGGDDLQIQAGSLQGLTQNSKVAFYKPGKSIDGTAPDYTGVINSVDFLSANVKLDQPDADLKAMRGGKAVITERMFEDKPFVVDARDLPAGEGVEALKERLNGLKTRALAEPKFNGDVSNWDFKIVPPQTSADRGASGGWTLMRKDGTVAARFSNEASMPSEVQNHLESAWRWRTLNGLENSNRASGLDVEFRFVPVEVSMHSDGTYKITKREEAKSLKSGETSRLPIGSYVTLEVRNVGKKDAYASILNVRSDGMVGAIWPYPEIEANNFVPVPRDSDGLSIPVEKRPWVPLVRSDNNLPYLFSLDQVGADVYKAIVTETKADFSPLIDLATVTARGGGVPRGNERGAEEAKTPLGKLLFNAVSAQRGNLVGGSVKGWSTSTLRIDLYDPAMPGGTN